MIVPPVRTRAGTREGGFDGGKHRLLVRHRRGPHQIGRRRRRCGMRRRRGGPSEQRENAGKKFHDYVALFAQFAGIRARSRSPAAAPLSRPRCRRRHVRPRSRPHRRKPPWLSPNACRTRIAARSCAHPDRGAPWDRRWKADAAARRQCARRQTRRAREHRSAGWRAPPASGRHQRVRDFVATSWLAPFVRDGFDGPAHSACGPQ